MPDHAGGAPSGPGLGGCPAPGQEPRLALGSSAHCPQGLFWALAWPHSRVHPLPSLRGEGLASRPHPGCSHQLCDPSGSPHLSPLENGTISSYAVHPVGWAKDQKADTGGKMPPPAQRSSLGRLSPQACRHVTHTKEG